MTDLSIIYSKTPKGLRARASLVGGLSSHLMKVLSFVDGTSKAEAVLLKFDHLTPETLLLELALLEKEGYIKASGNKRPKEEWSPTVHFTPMVVEEYQSEDELEAIARAKAEQDAKLVADRKANAEAAAQRELERIALVQKEIDEAKIIAASKAKAELKVKELLEAEAKESAIKAEKEAKEKAEKEKAEEQAKQALEAQRLAEIQAHEEAEKAKAEAEAKQRQKEKEQQELARIAKAAEDAQKIAEQKRIEQAELDAALKKAEEARVASAEAEAKQKAHLDIERVLREAEDKRKKSANKAKEDKLEAKRKAKAEEERVKAEQKSKEEVGLLITTLAAEEKAKAEEIESNQLKMDEIAKQAEEARISLLEKQLKDDEERANIEAARLKALLEQEEVEKAAAIEKTRVEMERISKEAEVLRKPATILKFAKPKKEKKEAALPVTKNADTIAITKMEERARKELARIANEERELAEIEAEEKAQKKAKRFAQTLARHEKNNIVEEKSEPLKVVLEKKPEQQPKQQIKQKIKQQVTHVSRQAYSFNIPLKRLKKWSFILGKLVLVYLPLTLLLLVGIMHFIPMSMLNAPIEKLISESVKDTVKIQEVSVALLPEPHLLLGNVTIGSNPVSKIESIYVVPTRASLFENVKVIKSAIIKGMQINHENITQPLRWIESAGNAKHLLIEDISLKNLTIKIRDLDLGEFDGKLQLTESKALKSVDLTHINHTLNVVITNSNDANNLSLHANNWALPMNTKIVFSTLNAKASANQHGIEFSDVNGEIYGGKVKAKLALDWSSQWEMSGNFDLLGLNSSQMLAALNSPVMLAGKLKSAGSFSSKTNQADKLGSAANMSAGFELNDGHLSGIEITRAVIAQGSQSLMGEDTHFDKFAGSLQVNNGTYRFTKVVLQSPQFSANAYFDILPNQQLSGKVNANLQAQSRSLQARFTLEGTSHYIRSK